ncbi:hypothetical protein MTBSS4_110016 [Magnetospirillum sp. SS-4]|nr:hypothetical protein MTBSS4_110016 [Magnetospirillum sp. SS-4]
MQMALISYVFQCNIFGTYIRNARAGGSSPLAGTIFLNKINDAGSLKSGLLHFTLFSHKLRASAN